MMKLFLFSVLNIALQLPTRVTAQCDACLYVPEDPSDCKDYGTMGDEIVGWPRASQECLDVYDIRITQLNVDSICGSANAFVNAFRFGDLQNSDAALGLGVAEGLFFEQDPTNNNIPKLKATITIDGTSYNCEDAPTDCWNGMKPYFEPGAPGEIEKTQVCQTLANQNRVNQQLEQSTLRIRLCDELRNGNTATECSELETMVQEMGQSYPDLACSAYGFGTGNSTIPGCEGLVGETPDGETPGMEGEDMPTDMPGEIPDGEDEDIPTDMPGEMPEGEDGESSSMSMTSSFMIGLLSFGWYFTTWLY